MLLLMNFAKLQLGAFVRKQISSDHKGSAGCPCIIGGSDLYYSDAAFAAMAAIRGGADTAFIISPVDQDSFRGISPCLIAQHATTKEEVDKAFSTIFKKTTSIVIGPGFVDGDVAEALLFGGLEHAIKHNVPLVITGEAIKTLTRISETSDNFAFPPALPVLLVANQEGIGYLTRRFSKRSPNDLVTFLKRKTKCSELTTIPDDDLSAIPTDDAVDISLRLLCTILQTGPADIIASFGTLLAVIAYEGSPRRPHGLGACLAGLCGTYITWAAKMCSENGIKIGSSSPDETYATPSKTELEEIAHCTTDATKFASLVLRKACGLTSAKNSRGFITTEVIEAIPEAFDVVSMEVEKKE